jgi:hypothetical protein
MKFKLFLMVFVLVVTQSLFGLETKIKGEFWNRYTLKMEEMDVKNSYFSLERGYFTLEPKFNDNLKGRFTLDFFSAVNKDFKDGAGLKLKYAYLDFVKLIPQLNTNLSFGLIKHYFGTIYDWNYTTIEKALEDREKIASSTDYGISLNGILPKGYGEYQLSILNGEGYKKSLTDVNIFPEYCVNVRLIPFPGITIGGSYLYENKAIHPDSTAKIRSAYAGVGRIKFGILDFWAEYLQGTYIDSVSSGYMFMPVFSIGNISKIDMEIVLRYDFWNPDKEAENDAFKKLTAGFNWNILRDESFKPVVFLQVNGERTFYDDTTKKATDVVTVQLRWIISNTIK